MFDRLLRHTHIVRIDGKNYRLEDKSKAGHDLDQQPTLYHHEETGRVSRSSGTWKIQQNSVAKAVLSAAMIA